MASPRKRALGIAAAGVAVAVAVAAWFAVGTLERRAAQQARLEHGRELAAVHCGNCHLEPDPDILPKRSWEAALGYMGYWLGMQDIGYLDDHPAFARQNVEARSRILTRENVLPAQPALAEDDWAALREYYVGSAPDVALPQRNRPPTRWELPRFDVTPSEYRIPGAVTTLVRIREQLREVYIGDSVSQILTVVDGNGGLKVPAQRFQPPLLPIDIEFGDDMAYVASIGDLMATSPSQARPAHIAAVPLIGQRLSPQNATVVIDDLFRMADIKAADLNGNGRTDFIVCGFGAVWGEVAWYESRPDGSYREHVLLAMPGAVKAETTDLNGDGALDIVVLVADAREGLHLFINDGNNEFEHHVAFETHPAYGHTYFELHDFNNDGLTDLLVVNGDNVDSDPYNTPKNYHGLRIYLNRGDLSFEEAYFYPLHGAFIAKAADFDDDGDLDIAAISFYPDYSLERPEAFVYLENRTESDSERFEFAASTSEEVNHGRWMTMDVGDIDGDGDVDVVLGGSYIPVGMLAYREQYQALLETGPSILLLKNTLY